MSNLKISPNLFLGTPELKRFQKFLSEDGYKKGLLNDSVTFGLIKNDNDIAFNNAKVSADSDINLNGTTFKTIRINPISGFDRFGNFFVSPQITQLPIPGSITNSASNRWFWVRVSHRYSHEEKGLWSLSESGIVSGSGGELTEVLRGQPNFPTRIRFTKDTVKYGALINTQEFDVLEVTDDNNIVLGGVNFQQEDNLKINVVGTFTYGVPVDPSNKMIFNYDSCNIELVEEPLNAVGARPNTGNDPGRTFYIARVRVDGTNIIIQDKRSEFWETKGSFNNKDVVRLKNPLIGIESIKFDHPYTARNFNIVDVAWSFRSTSWSINTETNVITLSSGNGGWFKTVNDFQDGDFDGWRLYAQNGNYSRVITSTKQGNAIDLQVDTLDIDSFSPDGGSTFYTNYSVVVAPNAEGIELTFTPRPSDGVPTQEVKYEFEINKFIGKCKVLAYNDPFSFYQLSYRYRTGKNYSERIVVTQGSFYDESSFDDNGNLLPPAQTNIKSYTGGANEYLIEVGISPFAYKNFNYNVDKGDKVGVQIRTTLTGISNIPLVIGADYRYQYFTGNLNLTSNISISLDTVNNSNGNEFILHFDATQINLNGNNIQISAGSTTLKTLSVGDFYQMRNQDGGIILRCKSEGTRWIVSQNYDMGAPGEIIQLAAINGVSPTILFDSAGWGTVKGLFGYRVADGRDGSIDARGRFIVGYDSNNSDYSIGATGGSETVSLTGDQTGPHSHNFTYRTRQYLVRRGSGSGGSGDDLWQYDMDASGKTASAGAGAPHENRPPYVALLFAQKMF